MSNLLKEELGVSGFILFLLMVLLFFYGCEDKNTIYPAEGNEFVFVIAVNDSVLMYRYADYYKIENKYYQLFDSTGNIGQIAPSADKKQLSIIEVNKPK